MNDQPYRGQVVHVRSGIVTGCRVAIVGRLRSDGLDLVVLTPHGDRSDVARRITATPADWRTGWLHDPSGCDDPADDRIRAGWGRAAAWTEEVGR